MRVRSDKGLYVPLARMAGVANAKNRTALARTFSDCDGRGETEEKEYLKVVALVVAEYGEG
jgi:hypothetical protein